MSNQTNESDYDAIIALLDRDFAAFYAKDFEAMQDCWVHAPTTCRWGWSSRTGMIARVGWSAIGERMQVLMRDSPAASANVLRRENLHVHIDHDTAWVTFDQVGDDRGDWQMDMPGLSHDMRVLQRVDGKWKIAFMLFLNRVQEETGGPLFRVDAKGKVLWCNAAAREMDPGAFGLALVRGHIRATQKVANQALLAAFNWGGTVDALDGKRSALPVVLENQEDNTSHIGWVLAESGLIQLSINDVTISAERLEAAALIYLLSPAQTKIAGQILIGNSMSEAASNLGISVTTARTQLQRMFEKVGVRTQVSLVRALLACAVPTTMTTRLGG